MPAMMKPLRLLGVTNMKRGYKNGVWYRVEFKSEEARLRAEAHLLAAPISQIDPVPVSRTQDQMKARLKDWTSWAFRFNQLLDLYFSAIHGVSCVGDWLNALREYDREFFLCLKATPLPDEE